jgi:HlyD family secretion protein/epimerase transport system membrane fusion protein
MTSIVANPPTPEIRGVILSGLGALVIAAAALGAWTALAPLSGAVIAPGALTVESYRKPVAHLEGGIVREILVRDGDPVRQAKCC